jgi:hypothetical protein
MILLACKYVISKHGLSLNFSAINILLKELCPFYSKFSAKFFEKDFAG